MEFLTLAPSRTANSRLCHHHKAPWHAVAPGPAGLRTRHWEGVGCKALVCRVCVPTGLLAPCHQSFSPGILPFLHCWSVVFSPSPQPCQGSCQGNQVPCPSVDGSSKPVSGESGSPPLQILGGLGADADSQVWAWDQGLRWLCTGAPAAPGLGSLTPHVQPRLRGAQRVGPARPGSLPFRCFAPTFTCSFSFLP